MAIGAAWTAMLGFTGSTAQEPPPIKMASVAYDVPENQIATMTDAMVRHMHVDRRDVPLALDMIATCGKTGGMEFRDLVGAIATTAPSWHAAYGDGPRFLYAPGGDGSARQKAMTREDGLMSVGRLCAAFESARPAYGTTGDTVAAVNRALTGRLEESRVARAVILGNQVPAIAHGATVRTDWMIRTGL